MAQDNDKGLYLPLKINLSEWEKSLTKADADLQKAMREMRSSMTDMKLRYDVEIAGAKAAGDQLKVAELEAQKLNQVLATQRTVVEALNRAYTQSVKEKGADAEATKMLASQLVRESKQLDRIQAQIDKKGLNIGKSLSDGLAQVSPEFAKIRELTAGVTKSMSDMGGKAVVAAKAIGGIGLALAAVGAAAGGLHKLVTGYKDTAEAAANADEEVYQLREVLNSSYRDAELLAGAARVDGVNINALGVAVNQLYKNIDLGNEKGKRAVALLEQYGAAIQDATGNRKGTIEFFKEMQKAYENAEIMGRGRDFLTGVFGASSDQFLHFIKGFDYYIEKAKESKTETEREYDAGHKLLDLKKQQAEAERALNAARGDAFLAGALEAQKAHNAGLVEQIKLYDNAKESLKGYSDTMRNLALAEEGANLAWEKFSIVVKTSAMTAFNDAWTKLKDLAALYKKIQDNSIVKLLANMPGGAIIDATMRGVNNAAESESQVAAALAQKEAEEQQKQQKQQADEAQRRKEQQARDEIAAQKKVAAEQQKALEKQKSAQEQFYRELRDLRSSDYEKEINQLNDRKQKWIESGIAIVDAEARFSEEKSAIDQKYFDKQQQEREKALKQAQDAYNKEVEAAKKAREANISEAESTLRSNLKLARYIKKEQEAGTYNEDNAREYANRLYMRQNNFRQSDVDFLKEFGVQNLKGIADARNRIFGDFANGGGNTTNNNSTVNINFDNTVVEDVNAMDRLANKVAEIITPAIQQALNGGTQYSY